MLQVKISYETLAFQALTQSRKAASMREVGVLALDFDNCIVLDEKTGKGSEDMKDQAWFEVFPEYEERLLCPALEQAKYDIAGGKGDRKDIAREVLRRFGIAEPDIENEIIRRCRRYNALVQKEIQQIGVSENIRRAIAALSEKVPLYINTGTPQDAVMESLTNLKLMRFFKGIYGRPGTKVGNLRSIIAAENINADELLFVDDQNGGWLAAREVGCRFVGIHTARNRAWHTDAQLRPFLIIRSLTELLAMV